MSGRPLLRTQLLGDLSFVTSSAVLVVGLATALVSGADLHELALPLVILWFCSTATFVLFGAYVLHRLVLRPLERLTDEADALTAGNFAGATADYASAELDRLADRYRAMAAELLDVQSHAVRVEKLASVGRLAAGVAHEVRNPLGALGNYIEVLHRRGTDPAVTGEMRCALERIERIVQGLVDYARPGGTSPGNGQPTDLNAAVRTVVRFLESQGMLRGHTVQVHLDPDLPRVRGDYHLLEQVVVNLIANAYQAAPGGQIVVGTVAKAFENRHTAAIARRRTDGDGWSPAPARAWTSRPQRRDLAVGDRVVVLFVADDGPGVAEADRERIFDPFFTTKDPGEGTGLGLAIVARTVYESGGVVWVDRAREGGAVFKVFLPIAGDSDAAADR
jgi:two-component system, NtrC family, sensor kinase